MVDSVLAEPAFALLDHIPNGVLVLRHDFVVAHWNACLEEWTGIAQSQITGRDIREFFPRLENPIFAQRLEGIFNGGPPAIFSSQLHKHFIPARMPNQQLRIQHTIVTAMPAAHRPEFYALIVIQDVTELTQRIQEYRVLRDRAVQEAKAREHAQAAEHQQRVLAETLRDITTMLNSTLELDQVLDYILANVERVIQYDLVDLMLVEDGVARIVRSHRHDMPGVGEAIPGLQLKVVNTPNLRQMAETRQPLVIPDVNVNPGWIDMPQTRWIQSYAGAPIIIRGQVVGFLGKASHTPGFFSDDQRPLLQAFADQAAVAIANARLYAQVQRVAITDELTGLYNRRGLFELGEREFKRVLRFGHSLAVILFDIDRFKRVNDTYGHPFGDQILRAVAACCRERVRAVDIVGRYGGEEIVVLLPEADLPGTMQLAEELRRSIELTRVPNEQGELVGVTISGGIAMTSPDILDFTSLVKKADQAQYQAKQSGRNRIVSGAQIESAPLV